VICIDPVKSKTLNYLGAAKHQYINPMTDVPLMLAIAHTLVKEGLHDQKFLDTYTLGSTASCPTSRARSKTRSRRRPSGPSRSVACRQSASANSPA
jgi:Anaerobic dehydrogenases, typically selenocysteine-containing